MFLDLSSDNDFTDDNDWEFDVDGFLLNKLLNLLILFQLLQQILEQNNNDENEKENQHLCLIFIIMGAGGIMK